MDTLAHLFAIMTATMLAATLNAWRLGNEKRDVALRGRTILAKSLNSGSHRQTTA